MKSQLEERNAADYDFVSIEISALPYAFNRVLLNGSEVRNVRSVSVEATMESPTVVRIEFLANVIAALHGAKMER